MRKFRLGLIILIFCCFCAKGFCEPNSLSTRIKLQDAGSVSKRANVNSSFGSASELSPLIDAGVGGMTNIMRGLADYSDNIYSQQQQSVQQVEYVRQQMNNAESE